MERRLTMGPLGLPWGTFLMFASAVIGCPLLTELILHSKWWKKKSDYYWSFNQTDDEEE